MEPRQCASREQFSIMIEFMERHGDILRPHPGVQGRLKSDQMWKEVTVLLNSVGGGVQKSADKWKKVWADLKTKTKKKYLNIRNKSQGTGGGPRRCPALTMFEERVVAVIGTHAITGQPGIQEQGFIRQPSEVPFEPSQREDIHVEVPSSQNTTSRVPSPPDTLRGISPPPPVPTSSSPRRTPSPPRSPPVQTQHFSRTTSTPRSTTTTTPRRSLPRARRNKGLNPFDRAASEFVAIEKRRLENEMAKEKLLHEREMERLRLEAQRIELSRQQNTLLQELAVIGMNIIKCLTPQQLDSGFINE
ncbi:unnamed protein product [Diatraea saccharalis]|uniref:Regulatory protein zeste n=1 Tax=Diatraea saccharalis TaxID=40085 RepID=A0A9N9R6D3_9NEOP|nr:unnamed protein product [Diatraea saccharalis]